METFLQNSFSVAVAAFLLLRVEKELRALRESITLLRHCQTCTASPWKITLVEEAADEV